ncbi:MAG: tRNA pseudouridine(54/55) synthase Pus10 [Candidatus Helarchaeota archaeon]
MIIETVKKILQENIICNNCLGRQFALLITGGKITNYDRGLSLKSYLLMETHSKILNNIGDQDENIDIIKKIAENGMFQPAVTTLEKFGINVEIKKGCTICKGIMNKIPYYADKVKEKLETVQFNNFLVGSKFNSEIIENEDRLRAKYQLKWGETIKGEFNREVGKIVLKGLKGKFVEFNNPEVVAVVNTIKDEIELNINPLFIYGRYLKLIRGIPQTHWICKNCNGLGCEECNYKGYKYETSIEELITKKVIEICEGTDAKFHGAGREDIDALMLGTGRPFVIEIRAPKKRFIDLKKVEKVVNEYAENKIIIKDLEFSDKYRVRKIKANSQLVNKTYRAKIEIKSKVDPEQIYELEKKFSNVIIEQRTPLRVLHRRVNKIRKKRIYSFKIDEITDYGFIAIITSQGGTYIKELISGDNGRTRPSVSESLGNIECNVLELDVIIVDTISID